MLLPRIITAILGIPIILIAIKFGGIPYFILITGIIFYALSEYFLLIKQGSYESHPAIGYLGALLVLLSIYFNTSTKINFSSGNYSISIAVTFVLIMLFFIELVFRTVKGSISRMSITLFGIFMICWTLSHLLLIRDIRPYGEQYTFYLFLLIWSVDTAAYFVGVKLGSHKLLKEISPKKSVEGTVAAIITGAVLSIVLKQVLKLSELSVREIILLGIIITIIGIFSDFSESLLKRDAGLKDSDKLLPGHGGILDRFDSFIFAAPLFYYYLIIFHK